MSTSKKTRGRWAAPLLLPPPLPAASAAGAAAIVVVFSSFRRQPKSGAKSAEWNFPEHENTKDPAIDPVTSPVSDVSLLI